MLIANKNKGGWHQTGACPASMSMNNVLKGDRRAIDGGPPRRTFLIDRSAVTRWFSRLRHSLGPTVYVNACDVPDEPDSPYRARLAIPVGQSLTGEDVEERELVRGEINVVYQARCACGRRWFSPRLERVQLCPRCGRAVLLDTPA